MQEFFAMLLGKKGSIRVKTKSLNLTGLYEARSNNTVKHKATGQILYIKERKNDTQGKPRKYLECYSPDYQYISSLYPSYSITADSNGEPVAKITQFELDYKGQHYLLMINGDEAKIARVE